MRNLKQRLETEEKWYEGDTEIALTDLSSVYSDLSGMSAEKILDTAAKPTEDAAMSVTVKWEDDTETTISFTAYDSSFHLAEINGEARKLVNKRDVEKLVEDMTALLKKLKSVQLQVRIKDFQWNKIVSVESLFFASGLIAGGERKWYDW